MTVRLRAYVKEATGNTKHSYATIVDGMPVASAPIPVPAWVEISEEDDAFYLFYFSADGSCLTDTWHQTVDAAKSQAEFEFRIAANEWQPIP
jgi:hypothetical protein